MKKFNGDTLVAALMGISAIVMLVLTQTTLSDASPAGDPGSRLFPMVSCIAILVFSIILVIQSIVKPKMKEVVDDEMKLEIRKGYKRMGMVFGTLVLFIIAWNFVPFLPAAIAFVFLMCMILKQKLLYSTIYSILVPSVLYFSFTMLLNVRLDIF